MLNTKAIIALSISLIFFSIFFYLLSTISDEESTTLKLSAFSPHPTADSSTTGGSYSTNLTKISTRPSIHPVPLPDQPASSTSPTQTPSTTLAVSLDQASGSSLESVDSFAKILTEFKANEFSTQDPYHNKHPESFPVRRVNDLDIKGLAGDLVFEFAVRNNGWAVQTVYECTQTLLQRKGEVIDLGGHIGTFVLPVAQRFPDVHFTTIEANPTSYNLLVENRNTNKLMNVDVLNVAVGDPVRDDEFIQAPIYKLNETNTGGISLKKEYRSEISGGPVQELTGTMVPIKLIGVDDLRIQNVVFIKIDIEGMEYEAMRGAYKTIERYHPDIAFECWFTEPYVQISSQAIKLLEGFGYKVNKSQGDCTAVYVSPNT